jgi:hypothetical protein
LTRYIWAKVIVSIIIGFGGTLFMIYLMFEALGIGELVWPILFPILGGTFGIILIIMVIVGVACRASQGATFDQVMTQPAYIQPTYHTGDYSDGSVYTVPVYCPYCKHKLEMNQVEWVGSSELTCPGCFRVVQAGVQENL